MEEKPYKRLYRSRTNKIFYGVLGGLGEYFEVDPVLFRVMYLAFTIFTGVLPGIFGYLVLSIIIPKHQHVADEVPEQGTGGMKETHHDI